MNALDPGNDGIYLYALSTCPWCRKAKEWFTKQQVPFEFVDVDELPDDEGDAVVSKVEELSGSRGFPVAVIDGQIVVGFNPEKYAEILDSAWEE
jgi:glutaredoxin